jgi:hypothetical protein
MRALNRWLIAGAVVATGLITDVAAQAFPGRTITRARGSSTGARGHHALKPAARAPQPPVVEPTAGVTSSPAPAPVVSAPAPAPVVSAPAPAPAPVAPAPPPVVSGGS